MLCNRFQLLQSQTINEAPEVQYLPSVTSVTIRTWLLLVLDIEIMWKNEAANANTKYKTFGNIVFFVMSMQYKLQATNNNSSYKNATFNYLLQILSETYKKKGKC